jgi:hypothetical protein
MGTNILLKVATQNVSVKSKIQFYLLISELGNEQCNFRGRLAEFIGDLQEIFDIDHDEIAKTTSNKSWIFRCFLANS